MINKQGLWFLTIFSLILVLSVYYITMPNDALLKNSKAVEKVNKEMETATVAATIEESELLVTMRVNLEDEREKEKKNLTSTLTKEDATSEEKNNAFEQIKYLTNLTSKEETIEKKIKKDFEIESFVEIKNDKVSVVAICANHNVELVNKIMKSIQQEFPNRVSITIKFEK